MKVTFCAYDREWLGVFWILFECWRSCKVGFAFAGTIGAEHSSNPGEESAELQV